MTERPCFHAEGGKTELRIPLSEKQQRNLQAMLEFFPNDAGRIAAKQAEHAWDWLSALSDPERREIARYCSGKNIQQRFDALAHFHKRGWVGDFTLEKARKELAARKASKLMEPASRGKLGRKILAALRKHRFPNMDSACLLLETAP